MRKDLSEKESNLIFDPPILVNNLQNYLSNSLRGKRQQNVSIDDLLMYPRDDVQIVVSEEFDSDDSCKNEVVKSEMELFSETETDLFSETILFAKKVSLNTVTQKEIEEASRLLYSVREPNCAMMIYGYNETDRQNRKAGKVYTGNGYTIDYVWKKQAEEMAKQSFTKREHPFIYDLINKISTYFPALAIKVEDLLLHINSSTFDMNSLLYSRRMRNIEHFAMFSRSFNEDELAQIEISAAKDWCYAIYGQIVDKDAERVD